MLGSGRAQAALLHFVVVAVMMSPALPAKLTL
jgi:hypothetical protein